MQKISIFGPIGPQTVEALKFQLDSLDRNSPLTAEINSDGGSVADGVTCFNLMRGWPGGLTIEVVGWALSIASAIAQSGAVRKAHASALFMVHAPWTTATGNAADFRDSAQLLDQVGKTMMSIYKRTGQSEAVIRGWLDGTDHWFTATEAMALGLIDEVITDAACQTSPANASATQHLIPPTFSRKITAMQNPTTTTEAIRAAAIQAEGERRHGIRASFAKWAESEGVAALQAQCENTPNCSVEAAGLKLLAHLGANSSPVAGHYHIPTTPGRTADRIGEFAEGACDAILARAGIRVDQPHPIARDLQHTSIVGMAERILSMRGEFSRGMSPASVISAAMGTDDFPSLLGNIANKALAQGYAEAPSGHALFSAEREVQDFKQNTLVNLSEAPGLEKVSEYSNYRHGAMYDSASTFKLATYGKVIQLSRQALINDDTSAFTRIPQSMGAASRRLEADMVFGLLTSNPVLGDGKALFSTEHSNQGASLGLTIAGLASARSAMRKQKGVAGLVYLDPQPKFLIVPVALETAAEQLLASLVDPVRSNNTPNSDFIRGLTLVADPRLDDASTTTWYLSADPRQIEGVMRAYLSGQPRPYLEENHEFRNDAVSFKVRLDFAAGVMDYRGLFRSASV